MTLCVLAAGLGSRYGGLKQLDPMTENGEFIIDFSVYDAIQAGFNHIVFIIKEEHLELFRETIGKRIEKNVSVDYAFQKLEDLPKGCKPLEGRTKPYGTGQALYCARNVIKEDFAIINADDFYGRDAFMKLASFLKNNAKDKVHHCMVGYRLGNTLTESGSVSRGVCVLDDDSKLTSITERTKIYKKDDKAAFLEGDVETMIELDTIVSMNCWGFTKEIFDDLESDLKDFMNSDMANPMKSEFYLPTAVDLQRKRGKCDVTVCSTTATWMGVTYAEDKQGVKEKIRQLIASGEYPNQLWK